MRKKRFRRLRGGGRVPRRTGREAATGGTQQMARDKVCCLLQPTVAGESVTDVRGGGAQCSDRKFSGVFEARRRPSLFLPGPRARVHTYLPRIIRTCLVIFTRCPHASCLSPRPDVSHARHPVRAPFGRRIVARRVGVGGELLAFQTLTPAPRPPPNCAVYARQWFSPAPVRLCRSLKPRFNFHKYDNIIVVLYVLCSARDDVRAGASSVVFRTLFRFHNPTLAGETHCRS